LNSETVKVWFNQRWRLNSRAGGRQITLKLTQRVRVALLALKNKNGQKELSPCVWQIFAPAFDQF